LASSGRRRRATVGSGGRCGGIVRSALDRVPFATARRSSCHAPSRGASQPRISIERCTATDPHSGDQREPLHLFSVLNSPPHVFLPIVPAGLFSWPLSLWSDAGLARGRFWAAIDRGDAAVASLARGAAHSRPARQGFRL